MSAALGVAYSVLLASFLEWAVHRYLYHGQLVKTSALRSAHESHHADFHGEKYIVPPTRKAYRTRRKVPDLDSPWVRLGQLLMHWTVVGVGIVVPAFWVTQSPVFVFGAAAVALLSSSGALYLHETMHRCPDRWITRFRLYRWLDARHRLHHQDGRINFNLTLPAADYLLGTAVTPESSA